MLIDRLTPKIRGLILDMDGVLWKDNLALVDLPAFFQRASDLNLIITLATNNATKSVRQYLEKIKGFGQVLQAWQIINSPMAVAAYLSRKYPSGGPIYVVGEDGITDAMESAGFYPAEKEVIAVVAGLDRKFTYEKLKKAAMAIKHGALFIGTNPDPTFPAPEGNIPGAGSILAAIQTATGVAPIVMGKPEPFMFELAIQRMGISPQESLVVGDRLDTDILGGQKAGCRTALVLSGISTHTEAQAWQPAPDIIAPDLAQLLA